MLADAAEAACATADAAYWSSYCTVPSEDTSSELDVWAVLLGPWPPDKLPDSDADSAELAAASSFEPRLPRPTRAGIAEVLLATPSAADTPPLVELTVKEVGELADADVEAIAREGSGAAIPEVRAVIRLITCETRGIE